MCSFQVRTLTSAAPSRSARIAFASGRSTMSVGVDGDRRPELGHRHGLAGRRLDRMAVADPPVVAAVEQPDVADAGVAQDQRGAGGGDLAGPTTGPLLVGVALGVAAVDDHRRVDGDPERAQRVVELGRRAAVPVGRRLQPVGVEVAGGGDVPVRVLLGDAEVHVEQEGVGAGRRLDGLPGEHVAQPADVDQALVVGQAVDRVRRVDGPGREPALEDARRRARRRPGGGRGGRRRRRACP